MARKAPHIGSKSEPRPDTDELQSSTTDGMIRQQGKCLTRANSKQFPTMCFVCTKGRSSKEDMCRFEGALNDKSMLQHDGTETNQDVEPLYAIQTRIQDRFHSTSRVNQ
jgi:hypothetical protein